MRWPFGPPHLTLKPSPQKKQKKSKNNKNNKHTQRNKKETKQEPTPNTNQQQNKNKANKTQTKATQKRETNTRNTQKHLNLPNPNKQEEATPQKKPKKWGKTKQAFLTLLKQCQTHQKQTIKNLKKQTQKTPFCHAQKPTTIFHKFSVFFKNTVSKTHFFNHVKKHFFQKKVSFLLFLFFAISAEPPIFIVFFCFTLFWSKKNFGQNR